MNYKVVAFVAVFVTFAAVHATLVDGLRRVPHLFERLGWIGPGYWLGIFWFRPAYRRFLRGGRFDSELVSHPRLLLLARAEWLLWWLSLLVMAAAVIF